MTYDPFLLIANPEFIGRTIILIVFAVVIGAGVFLAIFSAVHQPQGTPDLNARLAQFDFGTATSTQEAVLRLPFSQRVMQPAMNNLGENLAGRFSPPLIRKLEQKIVLAGMFGKTTPQLLIAQEVVGLCVGAALAIAIVYLMTASFMMGAVLIIVGTIVGYKFPLMSIDRKIKSRSQEIIEAMPNALDLLTISVEAGLAFDSAMTRVAAKYQNALSDEFHLVLEEMKLGRPRTESLEAMATRLDIDEVGNFITAVNQSEQMGTSLGATLRIQSEELRRRRTQRAEEKGAKAPVKMLLPMVGCIFPTIFIVLLGPAALSIVKMVSGG